MHCLMPVDAYDQTTRRGFTALSPQRQIKTHSVGQFFIPENILKSLLQDSYNSTLPEKVPPSESRTEDPSIAHEMWTELKLNAKRVH